jgi:alpha-N-arabinofuranosidase
VPQITNREEPPMTTTPDTAQRQPGSWATSEATIWIDPDHEIGRIDPMIYGHFLESNFFGNIEGGVFDEGSALAYEGEGPRGGLRRDVVDICRKLGVPVARWPGGNFASAYHWEDGTGPRARRPRRLELAWGGEESNRFGTDEFLAWCAEVGAEPYLVHSCRDVDEAVHWVEYTNYGGDTAYTRARAANGHRGPYRVRYWGVGNEVYGPWQMGHRTAERYAADAREHAKFMRLVDPGLRMVGVGTQREEWMRPLLREAGHLLDYVSLHLYGASMHLAGGDEYEAVVAQSLFFEQEISSFAQLVESLASDAGIDRPLAIALDEWTMRHLEPAAWPEPAPGDDGGVAPRDVSGTDSPGPCRVNRWSSRTLADALFCAGVFHGLHRMSGLPVAPRMANTNNLVNANGLITVRPHGVLTSAIYHVWDLYQNHLEAVVLPVTTTGPARRAGIRQGASRDSAGDFVTRQGIMPYLDAVATRDPGNRSLRIAVINRHPTDPVNTRIVLGRGAPPDRVTVHDIGARSDDLYAVNTFAQPGRVSLVDRGTTRLDGQAYTFPAHSITLLGFDLA